MSPDSRAAFEREVDRVCAELRTRLLHDVEVRAAGMSRAGGIRGTWAMYVRRLVALRLAKSLS